MYIIMCIYMYRKVLATEISKASVELATRTFKANDVNNIKILRLSSEEFTEAYEEKRIFQRVTDANIQFKDYDISTVINMIHKRYIILRSIIHNS
jgi:tRNA (uracil-5-)-methyltransferase